MLYKILFPFERGLTDGAAERSFSGVDLVVPQQIRSAGEHFATFKAIVRFSTAITCSVPSSQFINFYVVRI